MPGARRAGSSNEWATANLYEAVIDAYCSDNTCRMSLMIMIRFGSLPRFIAALCLLAASLAPGVTSLPGGGSALAADISPVEHLTPVTDAMLQNPDPQDWLMARGNYGAWGYSALDQIGRGNLGRLKLAWAWNMEPGYQEEAPLAHDGIVFVGNPHTIVQAIDGRTGDLLWEYRRELPKVDGSYHNDLFDRARATIALYADKVYVATADAHIVALDAQSGKPVWDKEVADYRQGYTFTGGPLVAKGKVAAGISGCTNPGTSYGCFIVALDADNGRELWRTRTIAQPGMPGDATWNGLPADQRNGGSVWAGGSYDPALNLLFWGTGGPIPHSEVVRGTGDGAVLYTDSTLALDADTGKIVWYRQMLPRDNWNLDHVFERVLVDIDAGGKRRPAVIAIGKPGIIWALDRTTGEVLWTRETTYQNVFKNIEPASGRVTLNESLIPKRLDEKYFVCPSFYGGKLWMATAFDPRTLTLFIPLNNMCMDYRAVDQQPFEGEDYGRGRIEFRHVPGSNGMVGRVDAVNLGKPETVWTHQRRPYWSSSLLLTAGGIILGGDANRRLAALDAASGEVLWQQVLNGQPAGFPMTYMAGGKQYIAVPTGFSLIGNRVIRSLTPEVPVPSRGSTLWVFTLAE
jgi:alcohol dehydrogenase (cytochrome c)